MHLPIDRCPLEVLMAFVEASEYADRRTLRLLDKTWRAFTTPFAFDSLVLEPTEESTKKILALIECKLCRWAKTLEYRVNDATDYPAIPGPSPVELQKMYAAHLEATGVLSEMSTHFPLLERLYVRMFSGRFIVPMHFPRSAAEMRRGVPRPIIQHTQLFSVLETVGDKIPPPRLRKLELHNILPLPDTSMWQDGFKHLIKCLESLSVSVHRNRSLDEQQLWETFWVGYFPDNFLAPTQPRLTSLSLVSDQPVGAEMPGTDLAALHFPRLRHLKLGGFCFDMNENLETFIVNHAPTLTSLVLDSCPLWTGKEFKNRIPKRLWSQIFARFERHLTQLMYLRVMCKPGALWGLNSEDAPRHEMVLTYEISTSGYGYVRGEPAAESVELNDRKALEKFYSTVDTKRKALRLDPLYLGETSPGDPAEQLLQIANLVV